MQNDIPRQFTPDDVIAALLYYLDREFSNDPEIIHKTLYNLQLSGKYNDLLGGFEFIEYSRFHYSPLLGRILNRLQESRLLSSRNPGYLVYQTKSETKDALKSYYLKKGKALHKNEKRLKEIASTLKKELANVAKQ